MNLQFFAEDPAATTGAVVEEQAAQSQTEQNPQPPPQEAPQDISRLVARESKKALEKLLQDAGITADGDPNARLSEYKKWLDSQKTDLEKAQGDLATATSSLTAKDADIMRLQAQIKALSQGVEAETLDDVIALAERTEGWKDDQEAAIKAVLTRYPHFKTDAPAANASGANNPPGGSAGAAAGKRWDQMTITEQIELRNSDKAAAIALARQAGVTIS